VSFTEKTIQVNQDKWFYRETNPLGENIPEKSTVVFLHGIPSHGYCWGEMLSSLGKNGFKAIAPDWLGTGFSDHPDKRDFKYTPTAYIEALSAFLNQLNIEECFLVIQGFLASVGIQYALRNPEKIKGLIILNTPIYTGVKLPWVMKQWTIPLAGDMLTQDPLLVDRTLEGGSGFVINDEHLDIYRKPFLKSSSVGRSLMAITKNLQLSEGMKEIETGLLNWEKPILIIWGKEDPWLSMDGVEKLAIKDNIQLITLPEAKHYPQEHWAKEINEELLKFLLRKGNKV
jgi:pimeloyl-ACP methyl ester carboxylesterase